METKTTKDKYYKKGKYMKCRFKLHERIIKKFIADKGYNPEIKGLEAIILGGGSGAGKTSVLQDIIGEDGYVIVDADKIKEEMPEYISLKKSKNPLASDIVHGESSDIATSLFNSTILIPECLVYDGTMKNPEKYKSIIASLKDAGYTVNMVVVDADVEVSVCRVKIRNQEGRFVSEKIVRETNRLVAKSFLELCDLVDSFSIYDNSVNGAYPSQIASKGLNGEIEVVDKPSFEKFIAKSKLV